MEKRSFPAREDVFPHDCQTAEVMGTCRSVSRFLRDDLRKSEYCGHHLRPLERGKDCCDNCKATLCFPIQITMAGIYEEFENSNDLEVRRLRRDEKAVGECGSS